MEVSTLLTSQSLDQSQAIDMQASVSVSRVASPTQNGPRATREQVDELLKSNVGYYDRLLLTMNLHRQTDIDQRIANHLQAKQTNTGAYRIPSRPQTPNDVPPPKGSKSHARGEKGLVFHSAKETGSHHRSSDAPAQDAEGNPTDPSAGSGGDQLQESVEQQQQKKSGGGGGGGGRLGIPAGTVKKLKKRIYKKYNPVVDSSDEEVEMILDIKGETDDRRSEKNKRRERELTRHFGDRYIPPERPTILEKTFSKDIWGHVEASKKRVALTRSGGRFDDPSFQKNRYTGKFLGSCDKREEAQGLAPPEFKTKDGRTSPSGRNNRSTSLKRKNTYDANNMLQERLPKTARARVSTTMLPTSTSSPRGRGTITGVDQQDSLLLSARQPSRRLSGSDYDTPGRTGPRPQPPTASTTQSALRSARRSSRSPVAGRRKTSVSGKTPVVRVQSEPSAVSRPEGGDEDPDAVTFALTSTMQEEQQLVSENVSDDDANDSLFRTLRHQSSAGHLLPSPPVGGSTAKKRKSTTFSIDAPAGGGSIQLETAFSFSAKANNPSATADLGEGEGGAHQSRTPRKKISPGRRSSSPSSSSSPQQRQQHHHPLLSMESTGVDEIFVDKGEPVLLGVGAEAKRTAATKSSLSSLAQQQSQSSVANFRSSSSAAIGGGGTTVSSAVSTPTPTPATAAPAVVVPSAGGIVTARGIRFEVFAVRRMTLDSLQLLGNTSGRFATEVTVLPHPFPHNHHSSPTTKGGGGNESTSGTTPAESNIDGDPHHHLQNPSPVKVFSNYISFSGEGEKFTTQFTQEVKLDPGQGATITIVCERSIPGVGVTGGITCFGVEDATIKSGAALDGDAALLVSYSHVLRLKDAYLKSAALGMSGMISHEGSPTSYAARSPRLSGTASPTTISPFSAASHNPTVSRGSGGPALPAVMGSSGEGTTAVGSGSPLSLGLSTATAGGGGVPPSGSVPGSPTTGTFSLYPTVPSTATTVSFNTDPVVTSRYAVDDEIGGVGFLGTIGYTIVHHLRHRVPVPWTFSLTNPQITGVLHQDNDIRPFSLHPPPEEMPDIRVVSGIIATNNDEFKRMVSYRQQNTETRLKKCKTGVHKDAEVVVDYGGTIQHECFKRRFQDDTKRLYLHGAQEVNRWNHDRERVYIMKFRAMAGDISPDTMERALTRVRKTITDSLEAEFAAERESVKAVFWTKFKKQILTKVKNTEDVQALLARLDGAFQLDASFGGHLLTDIILATPTDVLYSENIIAIIGSLGSGLLIPESYWHLPLRDKTKFLITTKRMIELPDGSDAKLVLKIPPKEVGDKSLRWILHKGVGDVLNRDDLREFLRQVKHERLQRIIKTIEKAKLSTEVVDLIKRIQKHNIGER